MPIRSNRTIGLGKGLGVGMPSNPDFNASRCIMYKNVKYWFCIYKEKNFKNEGRQNENRKLQLSTLDSKQTIQKNDYSIAKVLRQSF